MHCSGLFCIRVRVPAAEAEAIHGLELGDALERIFS
jgi:hypothetical protein